MRKVIAIALTTAVVGVGAPGASASSAPLVVANQKCFDAAATAASGIPTWTGTVSGAAEGTLTVTPVSFRTAAASEHFAVDFVVDAGERSFTARIAGIFNVETGRAILNGTITDGWLEGAQVHERSLNVDRVASCYAGTLVIAPASAG